MFQTVHRTIRNIIMILLQMKGEFLVEFEVQVASPAEINSFCYVNLVTKLIVLCLLQSFLHLRSHTLSTFSLLTGHTSILGCSSHFYSP